MRREIRLTLGVWGLFAFLFAFWSTADEGVDALIAGLKDGNPGSRATAARKLGEQKEGQALKPLVAALEDKEPGVRKEAARALGAIKDPSAVPPLVIALTDEDWGVRFAAKMALWEIDRDWPQGEEAKKAVLELAAALKNKDRHTRKEAAQELGSIKDSRAVPALVIALIDEDWGVRFMARAALQKTNPDWPKSREAKKAMSGLIGALKDSRGDIRREAAKVLGEVDPNWPQAKEAKEAVQEFIAALKDKDDGVREAAAGVLGEIEDPGSVGPLIGALKDSKRGVHRATAKALKAITGQDFGDDSEKWEKWSREKERVTGVPE